MDSHSDDPGYLKNYIKEHPNNKMAWYLLGRQYAAKGETGKANYCFAQAGEVYRAFEEGTVFAPSDDSKEEPETAESLSEASAARKAGRWKTAVIVLLLLLGGHIPFQSERIDRPEAGALAAELAAMAEAAGAANASGEGAAGSSADRFDVVYTVPGAGGANRTSQIGGLLERLQERTAAQPDALLLTEPRWSGDGRWLLWPAQAKPIATAERSEHSSGSKLTYYDAATCKCEPADGTGVAARYAEWQSAQLERLIVRSSAAAYETLNGKPPESIERMAAGYPDNVLSGYTPAMKRYFAQWLAERQTASTPGAASEPQPQTAETPQTNGALLASADALKEPIRILIDKSTHRLAVVSGNVLLRSYPVGLGGERTPEGEFTITEKVRNPNGRDNGTFGSRGMTLSDTLYAIHGTNQPSSIGKDKSLGCIRMLKPDVEELFDLVPKGTKVVIGASLPIPSDEYRSEAVIRLPAAADETNPNKTYKWLD
ncbi:L,D-transpeptidase family protein [Paenibacillus flagellatus]|uniref:L,D-transpeptidase n=1 Tax=Paenibacillus flagellatus TaxID=2211139 RepID=A0A2V5KA79_9BACL|nr:L,D-transpeptidase [Paenibacillus flagellatus]PYI56469.1 L,D-transpeptidase [Paenibacillus flagellatus]